MDSCNTENYESTIQKGWTNNGEAKRTVLPASFNSSHTDNIKKKRKEIVKYENEQMFNLVTQL